MSDSESDGERSHSDEPEKRRRKKRSRSPLKRRDRNSRERHRRKSHDRDNNADEVLDLRERHHRRNRDHKQEEDRESLERDNCRSVDRDCKPNEEELRQRKRDRELRHERRREEEEKERNRSRNRHRDDDRRERSDKYEKRDRQEGRGMASRRKNGDYDAPSQSRKRKAEGATSPAHDSRGEAKKDAEQSTLKRSKEGDDILTTKTGGAYIPPARLRMMQEQITDKASIQYQRLSWEALKKSINGLINKVNVSNIVPVVQQLFQENIVRGRGLLARSVLQAQAASPTFTHVYAALVAIINTKFPQIGELILKRLIITFRNAFRRNNKDICLSATRFVAHLVNQQVAHEIVSLETLTLLLETATDDSVEVAVGFLKEVGQKLTEVSPRGINAIFDRLRTVLHEGEISTRVQYMVEVMYAVRKDGFKDHPVMQEELDLVEEDDQFTHMMTLEEASDLENILNVFKVDPNFEETEEKYKVLKKEILDEGSSDEEGGSGSESGSGSRSSSEGEEEDEEAKQVIVDATETNLIALRKTIYLTIQSSLDFEECVHKLLKMELKPGQEVELCNMILDCCAQQRTYEKFYGLMAQRFCMLDKKYIEPFQAIFGEQYDTIHRLETNKLRNVSKFFAHLLFTDAISWEVMIHVRLNEDDTTSSSRIFIKILFQELSEYMGLPKLNDRLKDQTLQACFEGILPRDNPRNTRFAINFFTSIGLGGLTDDLREHLKNAPKPVPQMPVEADSSGSSSDGESSSSSSASSSSSDSESSSSEEEKSKKKRRNKEQLKKKKEIRQKIETRKEVEYVRKRHREQAYTIDSDEESERARKSDKSREKDRQGEEGKGRHERNKKRDEKHRREKSEENFIEKRMLRDDKTEPRNRKRNEEQKRRSGENQRNGMMDEKRQRRPERERDRRSREDDVSKDDRQLERRKARADNKSVSPQLQQPSNRDRRSDKRGRRDEATEVTHSRKRRHDSSSSSVEERVKIRDKSRDRDRTRREDQRSSRYEKRDQRTTKQDFKNHDISTSDVETRSRTRHRKDEDFYENRSDRRRERDYETEKVDWGKSDVPSSPSESSSESSSDEEETRKVVRSAIRQSSPVMNDRSRMNSQKDHKSAASRSQERYDSDSSEAEEMLRPPRASNHLASPANSPKAVPSSEDSSSSSVDSSSSSSSASESDREADNRHMSKSSSKLKHRAHEYIDSRHKRNNEKDEGCNIDKERYRDRSERQQGQSSGSREEGSRRRDRRDHERRR